MDQCMHRTQWSSGPIGFRNQWNSGTSRYQLQRTSSLSQPAQGPLRGLMLHLLALHCTDPAPTAPSTSASLWACSTCYHCSHRTQQLSPRWLLLYMYLLVLQPPNTTQVSSRWPSLHLLALQRTDPGPAIPSTRVEINLKLKLKFSSSHCTYLTITSLRPLQLAL